MYIAYVGFIAHIALRCVAYFTTSQCYRLSEIYERWKSCGRGLVVKVVDLNANVLGRNPLMYVQQEFKRADVY